MIEGTGVKLLYVHGVDTLCRLNLNKPVVSKIITQPSRYKRAESNLLADEEDLHHRN